MDATQVADLKSKAAGKKDETPVSLTAGVLAGLVTLAEVGLSAPAESSSLKSTRRVPHRDPADVERQRDAE